MTATDQARREKVADGLRAAAGVHERLAASTTVDGDGHRGRVLVKALAAGGTVLVFGNGGSAADAQHFAAELVGRFGEIARRGRRWR